MKLWLFIFSLGYFYCAPVQAQMPVPPLDITLSYSKTTNLLFPYAIRSVDRGSGAVLAQKAKGVDNILQLKAARPHFAPTNVTVVTSDGHFYSFGVTYAEDPAVLSLSFVSDSVRYPLSAQLHNTPLDAATMHTQEQQILTFSAHHHRQVKGQQLILALKNVVIDSTVLWFHLVLSNRSHIAFHPDYVRFFIQDRRSSKRTAVQAIEQVALRQPPLGPILYRKPVAFAVPFVPFTIRKKQQLVIQVGENNGGRVLSLTVSQRKILQARVFH